MSNIAGTLIILVKFQLTMSHRQYDSVNLVTQGFILLLLIHHNRVIRSGQEAGSRLVSTSFLVLSNATAPCTTHGYAWSRHILEDKTEENQIWTHSNSCVI